MSDELKKMLEEMKQLAKEKNIVIWTAQQIPRDMVNPNPGSFNFRAAHFDDVVFFDRLDCGVKTSRAEGEKS